MYLIGQPPAGWTNTHKHISLFFSSTLREEKRTIGMASIIASVETQIGVSFVDS